MPRPRCCRTITGSPACKLFKPQGLPKASLAEVLLELDEYEAIRLADHEGLYQEDAALSMGVSRQTFGRTIEAARRKVARALVEGMALRIAMPEAEAANQAMLRKFRCAACAHTWEAPCGSGRPEGCPACNNTMFHRADCTAGMLGPKLSTTTRFP